MKYIKNIKKYGVSKSLKILLDNVFKISVMMFHYLKMNIDFEDATKQSQSIEPEVIELNYDVFLTGDATIFTKTKLEIINARLMNPSYKAYGIVKNSKLIYSTWISLDKLGLPVKSNYKLLPEEGLLEDSYCHPAERGNGLHGQMNYYRLRKMYELGKRKCIAIVLDGNTAAYNVQIKSGFRDLGCFYAGTIFGISFSTLNKKKYDSR